MGAALAWPLMLFLLCAAAIALAGFRLSRSADALAEAHGWGRGWVGLALLATVTSLPELASGVSAVAWLAAPNLAVGNALGSCVVNLAFLVVVDLLHRQQPLYRQASPSHLLSAGFGVVMLGLVVLSLVSGQAVPSLLHLGLYSPLLLVLYLLALRSVYAHEQAVLGASPAVQAVEGASAGAAMPSTSHPSPHATRQEWRRFAGAALVVLVAGTALPAVADELAQALGLSRSFVGTVFMALVTTLPEMAVTVSALRLGALDMAIGNLLGSNLFNMAILAIDDLAYTPGPLLADAAAVHAGTAATALVMTGLVIVGLVMRPQGRGLRVASWVSAGLLVAYLVNAGLLALSST
jgi:cation:H+ antiporter